MAVFYGTTKADYLTGGPEDDLDPQHREADQDGGDADAHQGDGGERHPPVWCECQPRQTETDAGHERTQVERQS